MSDPVRVRVDWLDAVRARRKPRGTRPPKVEVPRTAYRRREKHERRAQEGRLA